MKNDFLDYSESLEHYGVLGMKWGVRKQREAIKNGIPRTKKSEEAISKVPISEYKSGKKGVGTILWRNDSPFNIHGDSVEVVGFDDSKYSKRARTLASEYAKSRVKEKEKTKKHQSVDDRLQDIGKEYITYLMETDGFNQHLTQVHIQNHQNFVDTAMTNHNNFVNTSMANNAMAMHHPGFY